MAATLNWQSSGLGTKTGTTVAALITDLVALFNTYSGDANFKWQVASSSSTASSPNYIVLKRKDGSAGRILLAVWTSAPAGANAAILDQAPATNNLYGAYFPSGNVDTPSNLTASSGTIMGNDTGAVKVWAAMPVTSIYTTSLQPFYFDSAEAIYFCFQNPASASVYLAAAGAILVDGSDNAYDGVMSFGSSLAAAISSQNSAVMPFSITKPNAGATNACVRTNYGSTDRVYYQAWSCSSTWAASPVGPTDILTITASNLAYFVPIQLLGQTKGEGFVLKLRQFGLGPGTVGPFTVYNTTGPTVVARQINAATTGGNGYPWLTNFEI